MAEELHEADQIERDARALEDLHDTLQVTHTELMERLGIGKSTYYRILRREQEMFPTLRILVQKLMLEALG